MAQLSIAGNVGSIGWEGRRITVWENYESLGKEYVRLWNCWFDASVADQVQEEDWVEFKGELSTKVGQYTNKQGEEKIVVEHHLNNAEIKQVVSKAQQAANKADSYEEMPF